MNSRQKSRIVEEAKKAFVEAISIFLHQDSDLPDGIHERTSVSRIAHHLANIIENNPLFQEKCIKVDVEYNRSELDIKQYDNNKMYVDLIVHRRCDNNPNTRDNILICEFKNETKSIEDKNRIYRMVKESIYGYLIGTTIIISDLKGKAQDKISPIWIERCDQIINEEKRK